MNQLLLALATPEAEIESISAIVRDLARGEHRHSGKEEEFAALCRALALRLQKEQEDVSKELAWVRSTRSRLARRPQGPSSSGTNLDRQA